MFSRAVVGELLIVYLPQHYNAAAQNKQLNLPCSPSFYQTFMRNQQAEKLKSREMKEGWWMVMQEDEGWMKNDEGWWFQAV